MCAYVCTRVFMFVCPFQSLKNGDLSQDRTTFELVMVASYMCVVHHRVSGAHGEGGVAGNPGDGGGGGEGKLLS